MVRIILGILLLFSSGFLPFPSLAEKGPKASEAYVQQQFQALTSEESDTVYAAVERLIALQDDRLNDLLSNFYTGDLYLLKGKSSNNGLVIAGEALKNEEEETLFPLYEAYPVMTPLLDKEGEQVLAGKSALTEVEATRRVRMLIDPLIVYLDLGSARPEKRKLAAKAIAANGTLTDIPVLQELLSTEKDPIVARTAREAMYMLQMQAEDPALRLQAVEALVTNKGEEALYFLEQRVTADENGRIAETDEGVLQATHAGIDTIKSQDRIVEVSQNLFTGLSLGSILILMALGLAIIYGLMGVINMAHGEFMMIGAYTTFLVQQFFILFLPAAYTDYFFAASLPLAFLVAGLFGIVIEKLIIRHLYNRPLESLLATWGVSLVLIQGARSLFGDLTSVKTPAVFSGGFELIPQLVLPFNRLFIIGLTSCIVLLVMYILFRTSFGLKIRAVTQNRNMSSCLGVQTRRVDSLAFFLGTGIAGLAGWAITLVGNVVPNMGQSYIVDSFLVVVTGGVGKVLGTIWSGLGIGFLSKFMESLFEAVYGKVIILALIILFLQIKPTGLFPAKGRNED